MSSLQLFISAAAGIPSKPALNFTRHASNLNAHDTTLRTVFRPSAINVERTSSSVREVRQPTTKFSPSIWGDVFLSFSLDDRVQQKYVEEIEALKKDARSMLMAATPTKLLKLIDTLERLGLGYHFETEIEDMLKQVYDSIEGEEQDYDLFTTALRFRLLRQHQYHVSAAAAFGKFVDEDNKLKESLFNDVEGLLSLYEAAHVRIQDENILDEAVVFTRHRLSNMLAELEVFLKEKVEHALHFPLQKSLTILNLRSCISMYERDEASDEVVLRLAKLNFNFLQNIYKNEMFELTKWWNKFDMKSKIPYFRDRVVEIYLWGLAYHFEPQYSCVRMVIAKTYLMFVTVDDTYDNYATLEEMELFTQAMERWNVDEIDQLPKYMNEVYKFVLSVTEEFAREAEKQEKSFVIPYFIDAVKQACRGYLKEQKWIIEQELPSFKEYMLNTWITALMYVSCIITTLGIKGATTETIEWLLSDPKIFISSVEIGRLLDDLATHERESKEGNMLTIMDCYMKDKGVSREDALCAFEELIEDRWKDFIAEWVNIRFSSGRMPKDMVEQLVGIVQVSEMCYKNKEDGVTYPERNFAPFITALLLDPPILI